MHKNVPLSFFCLLPLVTSIVRQPFILPYPPTSSINVITHHCTSFKLRFHPVTHHCTTRHPSLQKPKIKTPPLCHTPSHHTPPLCDIQKGNNRPEASHIGYSRIGKIPFQNSYSTSIYIFQNNYCRIYIYIHTHTFRIEKKLIPKKNVYCEIVVSKVYMYQGSLGIFQNQKV